MVTRRPSPRFVLPCARDIKSTKFFTRYFLAPRLPKLADYTPTHSRLLKNGGGGEYWTETNPRKTLSKPQLFLWHRVVVISTQSASVFECGATSICLVPLPSTYRSLHSHDAETLTTISRFHDLRCNNVGFRANEQIQTGIYNVSFALSSPSGGAIIHTHTPLQQVIILVDSGF